MGGQSVVGGFGDFVLDNEIEALVSVFPNASEGELRRRDISMADVGKCLPNHAVVDILVVRLYLDETW